MGGHQALPYGAPCSLTEIAALGVFFVGPPRQKGNLHICNGRTSENAGMAPPGEMAQDQPLPAEGQRFLRTGGGKPQSRAPLQGLQQ
ncbi:hypothetical protein SDC9_161162 [bioreactor metagenome]|uniref:Uncharacterized protein n=1 Tax=bioreactor metagenome TaxID=1076179 RepID=A0A645FJK9_9ZZZZ